MATRIFTGCLLAFVVCACGGETAPPSGTSLRLGTGGATPNGAGGAVGGTTTSGFDHGVGGSRSSGGSNSLGGTATSADGGDPNVVIGERPIPAGECQSDADCIAAHDSSIGCETGFCPDPIAASRADLAGDSCLWAANDPKSATTCPQRGQPLQCPGTDALGCPLCHVPHCDAGKCTLAIGHSLDDCDALGLPCVRLEREWASALDAARDCGSGVFNCSPTITDACGCPREVNGKNPKLAQAAQKAADALEAAGCQVCGEDACAPIHPGCSTFCEEGECRSTTCL